MLCGCGCALEVKPGRRYIQGHQGKGKSNEQRRAAAGGLPLPGQENGWNKGRRYVIDKDSGYSNPAAWKLALRRMFANACMRCGWDKAPCDTHHILPQQQGGKHKLENGIILCPNCHRLAGYGLLTIEELRHIRDNAIPLVPAIQTRSYKRRA